MDSAQLKLLASRLADRLAPLYPIEHGHALDLIAAVPGLRNWPEVMSFSERVVTATLDEAACARLAHRLAKRFGASFEPEVVRSLLGADAQSRTCAIWPDGPSSGIYVTCNSDAIKQLVAHYEANAGGAPLYGEQAAPPSDSAIDLGEYWRLDAGHPALLYQPCVRTCGTASKWRSRVRTGKRCCSASAAIHASLAGIGVPLRFNVARIPA